MMQIFFCCLFFLHFQQQLSAMWRAQWLEEWLSVDKLYHNLMASVDFLFHVYDVTYIICPLYLSCHMHIIPMSLTESLLPSCSHNTNSWTLSAWEEMPKEDICLLLWKWHRTATFSSYLFPFKALVAVSSSATYKFSLLHLHSWSCSQPRGSWQHAYWWQDHS